MSCARVVFPDNGTSKVIPVTCRNLFFWVRDDDPLPFVGSATYILPDLAVEQAGWVVEFEVEIESRRGSSVTWDISLVATRSAAHVDRIVLAAALGHGCWSPAASAHRLAHGTWPVSTLRCLN